MPIRSQDPDPEDTRTTVTWGYEKIPPTGKCPGFLAGPPTGTHVHDLRPTRPCRHRMSDRTLSCPYCADKLPTIWKGYVPFYTQDYHRAFVLISRPMRDAVLEIEPGSQIMVSRDKGQKSPIIIRAQMWRATPLPPGKPVSRDLDLIPFLVGVLWKDVELQRYHQSVLSQDSDKTVSLPPQNREVVEGLVNRIAGSPDSDSLFGEKLPAIRAMLKRNREAGGNGKAGKNGKHDEK